MASIKLMLFCLNCLWVVPLQSLVLFFTKGRAAYHLPMMWHRMACAIFRIRLTVIGSPNKGQQTLYMSNHISYLDIPVIGSVLKSSFVAKSEVQGWAVFGFLGSLQQTVYMKRQRTKIVEEKNALQTRMDGGNSLIIFPEGTSTSGLEVEPFKSSLFSLAMGEGNENLYIQPITLRVISIDGRAPQSKEEQDIYAWPRDMDMELHHHLWRFAKTTGAKMELTFHAPLRASEYKDRKVLAKACHERVSKGLQIAEAA